MGCFVVEVMICCGVVRKEVRGIWWLMRFIFKLVSFLLWGIVVILCVLVLELKMLICFCE